MNPPADTTGEVGARAEAIAESWLQRRGLQSLHRNYRWRGGEIDLIMREGATLAFVEVRYRAGQRYAPPEATIGAAKRRRLVSTAHHFLARHPQLAYESVRFDVVAMSGSLTEPTMRWLQDAFTADAR